MVLKVAKFAYASRKYTSQKRESCEFWRIANSVLIKVNLLYLPSSIKWPWGVVFYICKAKLPAKSFSMNSNLDDSGKFLPAFPLQNQSETA